MKSELSYEEWREVFLQKIRAAGFDPQFEEEIIELTHMEGQAEDKSVDEMAEETIAELKRNNLR